MTKAEVNSILTEAIKEYNIETENYVEHCSEEEKANIRKVVSLTMDCFSDFQKVIAQLAE